MARQQNAAPMQFGQTDPEAQKSLDMNREYTNKAMLQTQAIGAQQQQTNTQEMGAQRRAQMQSASEDYRTASDVEARRLADKSATERQMIQQKFLTEEHEADQTYRNGVRAANQAIIEDGMKKWDEVKGKELAFANTQAVIQVVLAQEVANNHVKSETDIQKQQEAEDKAIQAKDNAEMLKKNQSQDAIQTLETQSFTTSWYDEERNKALSAMGVTPSLATNRNVDEALTNMLRTSAGVTSPNIILDSTAKDTLVSAIGMGAIDIQRTITSLEAVKEYTANKTTQLSGGTGYKEAPVKAFYTALYRRTSEALRNIYALKTLKGKDGKLDPIATQVDAAEKTYHGHTFLHKWTQTSAIPNTDEKRALGRQALAAINKPGLSPDEQNAIMNNYLMQVLQLGGQPSPIQK